MKNWTEPFWHCPTSVFKVFGLVALLNTAPSAISQANLPSFPGAEGYGSAATGGRGGDVYVVTNLNASGKGSFFDAVKTVPGAGRTVVFAVSGHIRVPSGSGGTTISASKLTIAGQTAPGDGICLWNNTLNFSGDDVVVRHIRFRYGKQAAGGDAVDINGSLRLVFDHCDHMFSTDENLSSFGTPPEYFTYQWSINAWGLQTHSAGGLWDIKHATAHHSLWANNHTRNPKCIAPSVFDWANNVTFGWNNGFNMAASPTGGTGYTHRVNVRGSTFVHGASTTAAIYGGGKNSDGTDKFQLYMGDSILDGNNNGVLDASRTNYQMVSSTSYDQRATAWPQTVDGGTGGTAIGAPVTLDPRPTAYKKVLSLAGAIRMEYDSARPLRDEITQLCVARVVAQQRGIISDPLELGLDTGTAFAALNSTTAPTDSDSDGMPDLWENALGMDAAVQGHNTVFPDSGGFISGDAFFPTGTPWGYTHLEEYLHFKAQPHAFMPKNTLGAASFLDVDLSRYTSGFTDNPVFILANATGGTTAQNGEGGKTVRFTPTPDTFGRAGFDFTVTDSEGSSWTQRFCVLVGATAIPRNLVWQGNGTTNPWDTTSAVWAASGMATTFNDGDFVGLDDSGSADPEITLGGTLRPAAVLVDTSAKNYTLSGGNLAGGMSLTKRGSGSLTLKGNHTYTGTTTVEDGSLVLGTLETMNNTGDIGPGPLLLLGSSSLVNAWIGTQHVFASPISVPAGSTPALYTSRSIRFNGPLTGEGTLDLVNQGTVGNVDLAGAWNAFAGTLRITNEGTNGGIRAIFNGGSFGGLGAATLDLGSGIQINPVTNSGGNAFPIGSLTSTAFDSVLNGGTSGSPSYTVGALNASTTFAGKFQGNAKLSKIGTGTLTLTGQSTHTGDTDVSAGILVVDGSFSTSAVNVGSGATLGGKGALGGTLAIGDGGILDPEGTLVTGAFTSTAATWRLALSGTPTGENDHIAVTGNATLTGGHSLELNAKEGALGAGSYQILGTTGSLSAGNATFSHNFTDTPRQAFAVLPSSNSLDLVVTGSPVALAWSGAHTQWDVAATTAWLNGTAEDAFHDADAVAFTDSASSGTVTLAANVAPRSVLVDNDTRAFSFGGFAITGSTALVKTGPGTLTLDAPNSFSGGTMLKAGVIQLGNAAANASALGTGTITMEGGVLKMYSAGNGTHAGTLPNSLAVTGNARLEVAPRCGFSAKVTGTGTLDYHTNYVRADATGDMGGFTGRLNITTKGSGDFRIASNYQWPGLPDAGVNLGTGTYFYMSGIVDRGSGTTIAIGSLSGANGSFLRGGPTGGRTLTYLVGGKSEDAIFSGNISEQGTTTITALKKTGSAIWTLDGICGHRGATTVEAGTLRLTDTASITQTSDLTVQNGATLDLQGASVNAGGISLSERSTLVYRGGTLTGEATLGGALVVDISGGTAFTLIQNTADTPTGGTFTDQPEGTLVQSNDQTYRLSYLGGDGNDITLTALTPSELWRTTHFATPENTGSASDLADPDGDGEPNLLEFATAQDPNARSRPDIFAVFNGTVLEVTYTRPSAALADGLTFTVEWSDTLAAGSWDSTGVTAQILSDNGSVQAVKAIVPAGNGVNKRFVHLKVTRP